MSFALDIITLYLLPNETYEGAYQGPEGGRWVQKVWVVRGDTVAKHVTDCGPAENFPDISPERLMGDGETTVAEALDEMERHRNDRDSMPKRHLARLMAESTLFEDINRQREIRREYIANRTVIGPYQTTQRNLYNRENAWRKFFDKRADLNQKRTYYPS